MSPSHLPTLAAPVTASDHSIGSPHAPVTVLEYGDLECPTCAAIEPAVKQLRAKYPERLRFVFRHFPLEEFHPHALIAAEATESAAVEGKFWELRDLLLENQRHLDRKHLERYAAQLGLNLARFRADLDDEVYRQRIREHQEGGRRSHLRATPAFFVNGEVCDVSGGAQHLFTAVASRVPR
jgi:protein-disulfide isomerase